MWKRWNSWVLPTRLTLILAFFGLVIAVLQLFEVPRQISKWVWPAPPPPYDLALQFSILSLHRSNICLTSRLVEVMPDENTPDIDDNNTQPVCQINMKDLEVFSKNYTNYLAQIPYSGAESFKDFTRQLRKAEIAINSARSLNQLVRAQSKINMSLSEIGFWMCGMEWYLRSAPEGPGPETRPYRGVNLTETWNRWDERFGKTLHNSVARRKNYQYMSNGNDCSGFIDLLD